MQVVEGESGRAPAGREVLVGTDITKRFGGVSAADSVSITCRENEVVGLIGPNGAGKTTLMNVISGVVPADGGEIQVDGARIDGAAPERCARLGIARTFQNIRIFSKLTVRENIQVAYATAVRHRADHAHQVEPDALISLLDLQGSADRKSETLPYGLQRRLEIARALALAPRVLLLDEPAAGMNEEETEDLLQRIRQISKRFGFAVVVIDHDLRFIMSLCDRIYVMHMGAIIAEDAPKAIRENPRVQEVYLGTKKRAKL